MGRGPLLHFGCVAIAIVSELAEQGTDLRIVVDVHAVGQFTVTLGGFDLQLQRMCKELADRIDIFQ